MIAEVRDVTRWLSFNAFLLQRRSGSSIAPSGGGRIIGITICTLHVHTLVVVSPCDSIFLLQLARPPFVAFVAVAPPAIGHAMRCIAREQVPL